MQHSSFQVWKGGIYGGQKKDGPPQRRTKSGAYLECSSKIYLSKLSLQYEHKVPFRILGIQIKPFN